MEQLRQENSKETESLGKNNGRQKCLDKTLQGKGGGHVLFLSITFTCLRTFKHLFATLHVRWLQHIFNETACNYHAATQWDLPPSWNTFSLIDDAKFLFFTWWYDSRFLLEQFDLGNQWIWTCINYHPCITNKPTNQMHPNQRFQLIPVLAGNLIDWGKEFRMSYHGFPDTLIVFSSFNEKNFLHLRLSCKKRSPK